MAAPRFFVSIPLTPDAVGDDVALPEDAAHHAVRVRRLAMGDAERWVKEALASGKRIMGFGHRIYRAEDPRSRLLKRVARELGSIHVDVAEDLEQVALAALQERHPELRSSLTELGEERMRANEQAPAGHGTTDDSKLMI